MHEEFLRDLAFFLLGLGKDLKRVLRDPNILVGDPKFSLWLESAKRLGVIVEVDGRFTVKWEAIGKIKEKLSEVLKSWVSESD